MKKVKPLFLFIFIFLHFLNYSQIMFQKAFGGIKPDNNDCLTSSTGTITKAMNNSGYGICQTTISYGAGSPSTSPSVFFLRLDNNGDTICTKNYFPGLGRSIFPSKDNGFVMGVHMGNNGMGVIKSNSFGDTIWTRKFSPIALGYYSFPFLDGSYGTCGYTGSGLFMGSLCKLDSLGNLKYGKTYVDGTGHLSIVFISSGETYNKGVISAGYCEFSAPQALLVKTDSLGNLQWAKSYSNTNIYNSEFFSVKELPNKNILSVGYTLDASSTVYKILVIKTDSVGNIVFSNIYGDSTSQWSNSFIVEANGDLILSGMTSYQSKGNAFLMKLDSTGGIKWTRNYGGSNDDAACSLVETSDKGYAFCGFTWSFGAGNSDIYLGKTDSMGNIGCNTSISNFTMTLVTFNTSVVNLQYGPSFTTSSASLTIGQGSGVSTLCANIGIEQLSVNNNGFLISPNPASNTLTIEMQNSSESRQLKITDVLGKDLTLLCPADISPKGETVTKLDVKSLSDGVYFLTVKSGTSTSTQKFIVNH